MCFMNAHGRLKGTSSCGEAVEHAAIDKERVLLEKEREFPQSNATACAEVKTCSAFVCKPREKDKSLPATQKEVPDCSYARASAILKPKTSFHWIPRRPGCDFSADAWGTWNAWDKPLGATVQRDKNTDKYGQSLGLGSRLPLVSKKDAISMIS